jgi:hypothetical protein
MKTHPGIRWTIGNAAPYGFEALRLSIWAAWNLFGAKADYAICVNGIPPELARQRTGRIPPNVVWHDATNDLPPFLEPHLGAEMAEGAAWKFSPLRFFPNQPELSLDNDCILWAMPAAISEWLADPKACCRCVVAEDVVPAFGKFASLCGPEPRNSGIRGFPPDWDFVRALAEVLTAVPLRLTSELDEQGLAVAALSHDHKPLVVSLEEVTICSPFPPHLPHLGTCGAHFVGLNSRQLPWELCGRPASAYIRQHWENQRELICQKITAAAATLPAVALSTLNVSPIC